jgi:hypothetical protein
VVGSPYEYGVRGARHAILNGKPVEEGRQAAPMEETVP